ncbi:unnamed protein product [[Candida] boidinii]|nr:unnamed protein product [[Candida] boidinii]
MSFSTDHPNPGLEVTEHHTISVVNKPIAQPGKNQVLVHTRACGICGSDVHFWKMGQIGELKVEGKCILGHEACGDIVAVGEDVTRVKVGDRVAVEPQLPCDLRFTLKDLFTRFQIR